MITNISPIIPQDNHQAIPQDNQEANPQQNFDKIKNPILKDIVNNLGNDDRRQGYLSDLSNPNTEVFKSFFSSIVETKGEENEQVVDLYHTLNHNKMLNVDSFKNFILMNKNIKKYILDEDLDAREVLSKRLTQSGILTVGLSVGSALIGANCFTGCVTGVVAGTSIIVVNQMGRCIDHMSLVEKYKNFIGPVANTQSPHSNLYSVRDYLFIENGERMLQQLLETPGTPAVPLASGFSSPSTAPSTQNSMSESGQSNRSTTNGLTIPFVQGIGHAIGRTHRAL